MSSRARGFWVGFIILIALGGFVAVSLQRSKDRGAVEVKVEALGRAPIESWVRAPGKVEPVRTVQISSNVQGRVELLGVEEGDRVRAGDLLLRLDDERYRSQATQMRSRLEASVAQRRVAEAQEARAKQDLERKERLYQQKLIAPETLEDAATTARVESARAEAAREDVESTRAQLTQAEADLEETVFFAPISGIVTSLNVEQGENVITGTMNNPGTVILTIAELDTMQVLAEVDETDVVRIQRDQEAKVQVDALPDRELGGTVTSVGQSGRTSSGSGEGTNFHVEVRIEDPPSSLRPGMSADVEILTGRRDDALVMPIQALTAQPVGIVEEWEEEVARIASGEAPKRSSKKRGSSARNKKNSSGDSADDAGRAGSSGASGGATGNEDRIEGVFSVADGEARFHRVELGLRSETHVEVKSATPPLDAGQEIVIGPYRTLRELSQGDGVKPEAAPRSRSRK
ncbi:MAG: efflux RND transporter periplasmic adaptor subunit [Candidatus Eisenbacteria bacterium]